MSKSLNNTQIRNEGLAYYYKDIKRLKLLTNAELLELCQIIQSPDTNEIDKNKAQEKIVLANLRYVIREAKSHCFDERVLMDLVNEGNIGLIQASKRYDVNEGNTFLSYSVWWIRKYINMFIEQNKLISVPLNKHNSSIKIDRFIQKYIELNEYEPDDATILKELDIMESDLIHYKTKDLLTPLSLDYQYEDASDGESSQYTLENTIIEDSNTDIEQHNKDNRVIVQGLLKDLSPIEKNIILDLFGIDDREQLTLNQISDKYNFTYERIRQLRNVAFSKIKNKYGSYVIG